jgi:hypothetical protein
MIRAGHARAEDHVVLSRLSFHTFGSRTWQVQSVRIICVDEAPSASHRSYLPVHVSTRISLACRAAVGIVVITRQFFDIARCSTDAACPPRHPPEAPSRNSSRRDPVVAIDRPEGNALGTRASDEADPVRHSGPRSWPCVPSGPGAFG